MIERGKQFESLTKCQVEALLECFDFLHNGYVEKASFEVGDVWVIVLRHKRTFKQIKIYIRPDRYKIVSRSKIKKKALFGADRERYRLVVNSDMTCGVVRMCLGESQKLVSG